MKRSWSSEPEMTKTRLHACELLYLGRKNRMGLYQPFIELQKAIDNCVSDEVLQDIYIKNYKEMLTNYYKKETEHSA
jgi:hypothetical protein